MANNKYALTGNAIRIEGHTLYRIRALKDFGTVMTGDYGGFIESERNLSQDGDAWVDSEAKVFGDAYVHGCATVRGHAVVYGRAKVYGSALVGGNALVYDCAQIYGEAIVCDRASVYGAAQVYGSAKVHGKAYVYDQAQVYGQADVCSTICDDTCVGDDIDEGEEKDKTKAAVPEPKDAEPMASVREKILDDAKICVCGHRTDDYGTPEDNFGTIGKMWTSYLSAVYPGIEIKVNAGDVSMMMALLEIALIATGTATEDCFVDLASYAACGGEIAAKQKKEEK